MSLADVVRSGVALANSITSDLQSTVTWYAWTSDDSYGAPAYAAGVKLKALVEHKQRMLRKTDGQEIMASHLVTLLQMPKRNTAANRRNPIDPRDKIVLKSGETGPILDIGGFVDGESSVGDSYYLRVWMGAS